ncbi:T9SS type A sorting domain-containing protein [Flavobacterium paronense]|nr:T9SS type A sorting domain-containing protein [Flavobacterium paronense]MDN3677066.1 T9SS type A sorting domain-containing protein [Flavobacterium paronense]
MKKFSTILVLLFFGMTFQAQIINFPDANFKTKLLQSDTNNYIAKNLNGNYFKIDANSNGQIEVSEAQNVSYIDVYRYYNDLYIANLTGLSSFTNLKFFRCSNHSITNLNYSGLSNLQELYCSNILLTTINLANYPNLKNFDCGANQLTSLSLINLPNLELLYCGSNQLTSLNLSNLPNLKILDCGSNPFNTLDLSNNNALTYLGCSQLGLTNLNVSNLLNLEHLVCLNNQLTQLDISGLTMLRDLQCPNNRIEYIDLSDFATGGPPNQGNGFYELRFNNLQAINVKNGNFDNFGMIAEGNPNITYVCCDESEVSMVQSYYSSAVCNTNTYCNFTPGGIYYTIQGNHKFDVDNNGCDNNDITIHNLKFSFTDGTNSGTIISNLSGNYAIPISAGDYTLAPILENPNYFTVSPTTTSVSFPTTASPFTQNFCITPNGSHLDVETWIVPLTPARPGFDATYKIYYRNKGNISISGNVTFSFNDDYMDFISAIPTQTYQNPSLLTWDYVNLLPFETREIEVKININTPMETLPVNNGDIIKFQSIVSPLSGDEYLTDNANRLSQVVVGSIDPNDKTCVEGDKVEPDMIGEYVHYVIRFENTGTYAAENIVVKDLIDTDKFDISTLFPLNGSHSYITKITNTNQVEFIFENINLPFDNANNDGYVTFKIKTKPTLVVGDSFSNTANIYFDYNFPIVTNTATTTITALGNQDFEFTNLFSLSPVPAKNSLTITTKQNVTISSVSIYNTLGQLVQVNTNPNETIDVSELKAGNYFIKIVSDKGTASSKFVKE